MTKNNISFEMLGTGHEIRVGSIVIFDMGGNYPMIGMITDIYRDKDQENTLMADIMRPCGDKRIRSLEYDVHNGAIALLPKPDAAALKPFFDSIKG